MSDKALLPCPSGHTKTTRDNNNIYGAWWVKCADGECSWRTAGATEDEAIAAWNTRVQSTSPGGAEEWKGVATQLYDVLDRLVYAQPEAEWREAPHQFSPVGSAVRMLIDHKALAGQHCIIADELDGYPWEPTPPPQRGEPGPQGDEG